MSDLPRQSKPFRIGSVSYLNARPLIYNLENRSDVQLTLEVPSRLLDGLREDRFEVALLPVIDYQRLEGLTIIPAGGIGSDGETLTVRIFSRVPISRIATLACDPDSHTSVALARIILSRRYGLRPEFRDLSRASGAADEARLLIGDKVVCEEPLGFVHQLDLGREWKLMSGLPFVFATWMACGHVDADRLSGLLTEARIAGLAHVEQIIEKHALARGWPAALARQYLTHNLKFEVGDRELEAIRLFHALAGEEGLISPVRELTVFDADLRRGR
jgi:chorismate dehydratase